MTTELRTRKPTGRPSWPILLLAGAEKAGKSYSAAVASASDLIGRTYWVTIGEDEPDEYGQLGDFDIVEHDGSYVGILTAIHGAAAQPVPEHGVPLLVVDSMTRLWDLITNHAQDVANKRKNKRPGDDAQITMDLWNAARDQWAAVMDAIREFPGPVILTARLELVAVMADNGQPTTAKDWKVQAHKSLPYDAGAVIQMPARGETWITGVRSVRYKLDQRKRAPKEFTVDWFWRQLGLGEVETGPRDHAAPRVVPEPAPARVQQNPARTPPFDPAPYEDQIALAQSVAQLAKVRGKAVAAGHLQERMTNGETLEVVLWRTKGRLEQDARAHHVEPPEEDEPEPRPEDAYAYDPAELPF